MGDSSNSTRRIKVIRLIDEYDLEGIGPELEDRWTTDSNDRTSLRDLADYFNQQLLGQAMTKADTQPLSGEVENIYRLLTADDVGGAERTRTRRRLEREGIEVEKLERDFLTYQAIRTYLKEHRGAEHPTDDQPRTEVEVENLQRIRGRIVTVSEGKLEQLVSSNQITHGDFRVFVDINVLCEDCGSQYDITELIERGGCDCDPRADSPDDKN